MNCLIVDKGAASVDQHQVCMCCFQLLKRLRIYPEVMTLPSKENKLLCGHREGIQLWHSLHDSVCKTIYAIAKLKLQLLAGGWLVDVPCCF